MVPVLYLWMGCHCDTLVHSPQPLMKPFHVTQCKERSTRLISAPGSQKSVISAPMHHFLQQTESLRDERGEHRVHSIRQTVSTASESVF